MAFLQIKDISYKYPGASAGVTGKVSFSIEKGSYTAILGANGSGKSTLARLMCGFLTPDTGSVTINDGTEPAAGGGKAPFGIVFQDPKSQIIAGIVKKDTELGPRNIGCSQEEASLRADQVLELTKLDGKKDGSVLALSLGQTQKLALSGILALKPDLLVLDEPVSMVDPAARAEILEYVNGCNRNGQTVITITHDLDEAMMADHILVMNDGDLIFDGSREQFSADPSITEKIFGRDETGADHECHPDGPGLILKNLDFSYGTNRILDHVSAEFRKGTITAITGSSGAGKSTLFEIIAGLLSPDSGEVLAGARPVLALQDCSSALFEEFAADDVAYGPLNRGITGKELKERVSRAMDMVGLPYSEFAEKRAVDLSGGQKRKLAAAGIIAMNSDVMLFDEPCAGLDPIGRRHLLDTFRKLRDEGKTIIFSTHRLEEADFADRHLILKEGRLLETAGGTSTMTAPAEAPESMKPFKPLDTSVLLSRLRATTSGIYESGNAPVYRLSPAWKYIVFLAYFIPGTVVHNVWFSLAMVPLAVVYAALTGLPVMRATKNVFRLIPWLLIFSFLQLFLMKPDEGSVILMKLGIITLSSDKLLLFAITLLHLTCGIFCIYGFLHSISETEAAEGFQKLVPSKTAALIVIVLFRFIPLLADEAALIMKVQLIRGGLKQKKGFFNNLKSLLPLFVPLIIRTIQRAENMAEALTARYF